MPAADDRAHVLGKGLPALQLDGFEAARFEQLPRAFQRALDRRLGSS